MSGIFGFSYRSADQTILQDAIGGLEYWNHTYGRDAVQHRVIGCSGLGCHIEHFSDQFSNGAPIQSMGGRLAVVDCLLFNRDELLPLLDLDPFSDISDEELLLSLIDNNGMDVLAKVNGDFAGAIYDNDAQEWTLFRDHLGVRPLFYYLDDDLFAFSTDIRGLAALPNAKMDINELQHYRGLIGSNSMTLTETDFDRIRCLHPASVTRFRMTDDRILRSEHIYWRFKQRRIRMASDQEYQAELRHLVTDSVNRRCDAISGLLGAEFSGGLDSSVIDILINRHNRKAVFYSWSRDPEVLPIEDDADERNIILDICRQEQITCHFRRRSDMFQLRDKGEHLIPPGTDTVTVSYGSSWIKSQGANVVFTGHGGDEGISHRSRLYELWLAGEYLAYFKMFHMDLKGKPFRTLRSIRAGLHQVKLDQERNRRFLQSMPNYMHIIQEDFRNRMSGQFHPIPFTFNYDAAFYISNGGSRPRIDSTVYQGALNGVRYLFPYLDYRVIDFALSIPRSQFLTPTQNRAIFRNAFRDMIPDSLYEVKQKFTVSLKSIPDNPHRAEEHQLKVTNLLNKLDRNLWAKYIDFHALEQVLRAHDGSSGGVQSIDSLMNYLVRCFRIQDVIQNAKRWREFDAQDKTV